MLSKNITPDNLKLESNIRTPKSFNIIRKVEKQLLNECLTTVNSTIELSGLQREIYIGKLARVLDEQIMKEHLRYAGKDPGK